MTRVRKVAAVALMTPLAATAIAISVNTSTADADTCFGLSHGKVNDPAGPYTVGETVHASATVSAMLLGAHLQIVGPGVNQQLGANAMNGVIGGDVKVTQVGDYTLSVIGNGTKCTYDSAPFTVKARTANSPKPTHSSKPHRTRIPTGIVGRSGGSSPFRGITPNGGGNYAPLPGGSSNSPFSLPSVAPDGSSTGFQYPTPDPQVAAPPTQPLAHDVSRTPPVKWGQSVALAMVLLLLSAHLGAWSRRHRLATAGPRTTRGAKTTARRKNRPSTAEASAMSETTPSGLASTTSGTEPTAPESTGNATEGHGGRRSAGRVYHGRRRRS